LDQHYAGGYDLKTIARHAGVSYSNLLDRYHATIKLVRERLRGLGVAASPPRAERAWNVLHDGTSER
jgi:hypothetical protein